MKREDLISLLNEAFEAGFITSSVQSQIDTMRRGLKMTEEEYRQLEDDVRIDTYIRKVKERERKGVTFMGDLRKQYKITEDDRLRIQERFDRAASAAPQKTTKSTAPVPPAARTAPASDVLARSEQLKNHAPGMPAEEVSAAAPAPAKKKAAAAPPPSPAAGPLILIADDNETQLFLTRKTLEESGYQCVTADTPESAVRIIAEKQPALVLCDINFGIGRPTGMDVFTNTRTKKFMMPFILVSAFIQKEFMEHAKRIGVTEYITKPTEPDELIAVVKKYLK
ncbi:MAG: response regulator [Bacteroidetes bacterium]|nr:response regulator [Bacteroidota bacterium]